MSSWFVGGTDESWGESPSPLGGQGEEEGSRNSWGLVEKYEHIHNKYLITQCDANPSLILQNISDSHSHVIIM